MAKKLKDYYDVSYVRMLSEKIAAATPVFDSQEFLSDVEPELESLEFGPRQQLIAEALYAHLDLPVSQALDVFESILGPETEGSLGMFTSGWWLWPIGRYVELHGAQDYDRSLTFCRELTKRYTGEFAMRTLLVARPQETMNHMVAWSTDPHPRIRRLASECLRTRLPWSKKLYYCLDYFDLYTQVLTNLKDDRDKTIQKSVANNLNDLYKDAPEKFEHIVHTWSNSEISSACQWIIHHGSRTKRKDLAASTDQK